MSADVVGFYAVLGVELPSSQVGANVSVACFTNPERHAHDDKNRSASVSLESGAFNCHGCEARGGAYDAALALGKSPREAMDLLDQHGLVEGDRACGRGRAVGAEQPPSRVVVPEPRPAPSITEEQMADWQSALVGNEIALARLEELRGWSPEAIKRLGVGMNREFRHPGGGGTITFLLAMSLDDLLDASTISPTRRSAQEASRSPRGRDSCSLLRSRSRAMSHG